jgi:hypothetical protein
MTGEVEVYRNLRSQCWSIRERSTGKVIAHANHLVLRDATFIVRPGGRERVRQTGHKTVHAFVRGSLTDRDSAVIPDQQVRYNPRRDDTFHVDGEPVTHAATVVFTGTEVYVEGTGYHG